MHLAYLHAFLSVPECFKRPDKLIFAWVSPCPRAGSPGGEKCSWQQSDAAKGCEAPLEHPCFVNTDSIRSDGIYSCVQLFIPHFIPRCCTQTSGQVFPPDGLSICSGHFFCLLCRQIFFPTFCFSFPKSPLNFWCLHVHWQTEKSPDVLWDMLIVFCQALPAYHFPTTFHATLSLKLHCQVYSSLCPNIYILWKSHPPVLPLFHAFCHPVQRGNMMLTSSFWGFV